MITVRKMQTRDIRAVRAYGERERRFAVGDGSQGFWSPEQLARWINMDRDVLLVAVHDGAIVGYVTSQHHRPTGKAVMENLFVADGYRERGVGCDLVRICAAKLRLKGATYLCAMVEPDNEPLRRLFDSIGFRRGRDFVWTDKVDLRT